MILFPQKEVYQLARSCGIACSHAKFISGEASSSPNGACVRLGLLDENARRDSKKLKLKDKNIQCFIDSSVKHSWYAQWRNWVYSNKAHPIVNNLPKVQDFEGQPLAVKPECEGVELSLKDEDDIAKLQFSIEIKQKRIHNSLTNKLKKILTNYTLLEGNKDNAMYDILVKNYDFSGNDLLIEVKSNSNIESIRLAIGQLFDYWYSLKGDLEPCLSVFVPNEPNDHVKKLLDWLNIGLLWLSEDKLQTSSDQLKHLL